MLLSAIIPVSVSKSGFWKYSFVFAHIQNRFPVDLSGTGAGETHFYLISGKDLNDICLLYVLPFEDGREGDQCFQLGTAMIYHNGKDV